MKKSKKIMLIPFMLGVLGGTTACSMNEVNINKESMNQIMDTVDEYMASNNAYSSEYTKDSLMTLLNKGIFEMTSKQYVNYEMTEKIKANDSFGNKDYASEPYCVYFGEYNNYMTCIQPYLNVKAYYDETNSMFKYYEKNAIYNNIAGEESSIFWEKYTFVEYDADTEYTKVVYDVEEKSKSTVSAGAEYGLDFTYSIRPLNYYKRIYNQINSDEVAISFNKVDETTVEYTINDYKNNVVVRCTFVNGMLEKYVLASFEAGYGEPTHHGIVEVDIKYSCDDMTIADVESYTEVTE